jgi:magnesium transporter
MQLSDKDYERKIRSFMKTSFITLDESLSVQDAIDQMQNRDINYDIVYFYTVDKENHLTGVIPVKKLIMSKKDTPICAISNKNVITLTETMTLLEASEMFIFYKFLSFPVVNKDGQMKGIVDISIFTKSAPNINNFTVIEETFQTIGVRLSELKNASVWKSFRYRFPWLLSTLLSGVVCAMIAGYYETTLFNYIILSFFLTLVLALGESVSSQSMTLTIQRIHLKTEKKKFLDAFFKEILVMVLIGLTSGGLVFVIAALWKQQLQAPLVIGISITLSVVMAGVWGYSVPQALHKLKLDPKIAAGPVTLAFTDLTTIFIYLTVSSVILKMLN